MILFLIGLGVIAISGKGQVAAGTSTNGANHKIPGYVQPITRHQGTFSQSHDTRVRSANHTPPGSDWALPPVCLQAGGRLPHRGGGGVR